MVCTRIVTQELMEMTIFKRAAIAVNFPSASTGKACPGVKVE
jgi:hypothetical protein